MSRWTTCESSFMLSRMLTVPAGLTVPAKVLAASLILLGAFVFAASSSMLPFQLDAEGRAACAMTRSGPGPDQRAEAVVLAGLSDVAGLREAADPGIAPRQRYDSVEIWCSSND